MSSATNHAYGQGALGNGANLNNKQDSGHRQTEAIFVEWATRIGDPLPRKAPPRLYHKKSRTGCAQCRARRVKCDEVHPICSNCQRHNGECNYDRTNSARVNPPSSGLVDRTRSGEPSKSISNKKSVSSAHEIPETKERRLLELSLMHRFTAETVMNITDFAGANERERYLWSVALPRKAIEHGALLDSIYTITALHWAKVEPDNEKATEAHRMYLDLALSGHRDDVATLNGRNADAVCMTSSLIRVCIFSSISTRDLEPYTPPYGWLKSVQVSGEVWAASWKWIENDETAIASALFKAAPIMMDPALMFSPNNRKGLGYLLTCNPEEDATHVANPQIFSAYETTLSYIGGVKLSIAAGEPKTSIIKRVAAFPMWISRKFTPLVEEGQPRALVILCHYFALLIAFRDYWWIGDMGEREILAIEKMLPPQWLPSIAWPIQVIEDPSILTLVPVKKPASSPDDATVVTEVDRYPWGACIDFTKPFGAAYRGE